MTKPVTPSLLGHIKRQAQRIRKERGLQHALALDAASSEAGFANYREVQNCLKGQPGQAAALARFALEISAYWRDRQSGASGHETLTLMLDQPLEQLLSPKQLDAARRLRDFRRVGEDRIEATGMRGSQESCRSAVMMAARTIQFAQATGLVPSAGYSKAYPGGSTANRPPGEDHATIWYDRSTRSYVIADEPYEQSVQGKTTLREQWAITHGYEVVKPAWPGMYNPEGGSRLFLLARAGTVPLTKLSQSLSALVRPPSWQQWKGKSSGLLTSTVSRPQQVQTPPKHA